MTTTHPATTGQRVTTPSPRRVLRRALFWIGAAVFILVVGLVSVGVAGSGSGGAALSATNAAPGGAKAVAEVLRQQGVTVTATGSLAETKAAIDDAADTTLLVYDPDGYLATGKLREAVALADTVVLVDASFTQLREVAPGVAQAGVVKGTLTADCSLPAVTAAGKVSGAGVGYRATDATLDATTCLGSGDKVYSLVQLRNPRTDGTLTVLGTTDALTNDKVIAHGNAALALNLLGAHRDLVWYIPTFADVPASDGSADLASFTPGWVIPVMSLLAITFLMAAIWRGRRLGPLVVENLPVTVRASETMFGRARLYERSSSRLRAVDSLRIGAIGRLAALCGLPRVATVDEVVSGVASATGRQVGDVRRLLVDDIPASDRDLITLSDALLVLERDVAAALRP